MQYLERGDHEMAQWFHQKAYEASERKDYDNKNMHDAWEKLHHFIRETRKY